MKESPYHKAYVEGMSKWNKTCDYNPEDMAVMELSKRAKDMLDNCIAADETQPFFVKKAGWVKMLTLLHELALSNEKKIEAVPTNEPWINPNENKNLGDKRPISGTESAVRTKGIRDEVVEAVESSSGDERRGTDPGKRS